MVFASLDPNSYDFFCPRPSKRPTAKHWWKVLETNTLAASLLTNSRVRRISNPNDPMSTYERMSQVNFIRDTLYNIQLSNSSVSNICLHLPLLHLTYNPDNAYDYPTQTAIGSSTDLSDDEIDVLLSLRYLPEQLKMHNGNFSFVSIRHGQIHISLWRRSIPFPG